MTQKYDFDGPNIIIDTHQYDVEIIKETIREILEESGLTKLSDSLDKSFEKMFAQISELKDSRLRKFIFDLLSKMVITFLFFIITPKLQVYYDAFFEQNRNIVVKRIGHLGQNLPTEKKEEIVKNYRFVTAKTLLVRNKPSQQSQILGRLYFGQVVNIVQKNRNWTLISWQDEQSGLSIRGWVFTRYIKKFR